MGNIIKSIVLSSGTVVNISAFPLLDYDSTQEHRTIYSRGGCCLCHFQNDILQGQLLSDQDMIELGNIINGTSKTGIQYNVPSVTGQYISFMYWYYDAYNHEWRLQNGLLTNGDNIYIDPHEMWRAPYDYYDGEDPTATGDIRDFYWGIDHVSSLINQMRNVRQGPSLQYYTLDIATNLNIGPVSTSMTVNTLMTNIERYIQAHPDADITIIGYDPESNDDPFIVDDPSSFGGGGGSREDPDEIEKATIPPLPELSAVDTGLVTLYTATNAQLQSLGAYLWSNLWDIETNFKKLFADPMNCLIGLSIVPVRPTAGGAQNVKFGNITTNIALNKLASQFVEVDCGSVNIKEYVGSFLDYSPYVNISIYLPYIGYRELSPDDVMNDTIHVVYHIDVLSGGCCAMIETGRKGLLYSFNGSCITNVPITAINYSGAIQNAVSAVGAGLTTVAGIATGAAPVAAVGAASMLSSAANTAMNSKPTIQRSGAMGGSAGLMSYQKPLLVITRPRMSVPDKLNKFVGLTTNVTMKLSQVKGFTQVEHVHLSGIAATEDEKQELMTLLRQGVIF